MDIRAMKQKRAAAWEKAKAISDIADNEKRDLTAEERQQWAAHLDEVDTLAKDIDLAERQAGQQADLERIPEPHKPDDDAGNGNEQRGSAIGRFLRSGLQALTPTEQRDLAAGVDTAGGYISAGEIFVAELIKNMDNMSTIRGLARKFTVDVNESLGVPTLDANPASFTWGGELQVATADTTMAFGKRELSPHDATMYIKVSRKLLASRKMDAEAIVRDRLAYEAANNLDQAYMSGTGAGQPLGVFTASANGISTSRDVSNGNTTTAIGADGLINAKYSIKAPYWPGLRWVFHRLALREIRKLKDGNGQYLWQMGLVGGQPDSILDVPVIASENAPSTFTSQLYVGIIGDFSKYWIADAANMQLQRLDELLALTNQVGFIGRLQTDGMPVLEEAFARVQLA